MKLVVTGSLGNISKPLTTELVQNAHSVTVISSSAERKKDIETLGAKAAIGTMEDVEFLTSTFTGADAVYVMTPPAPFFDSHFDPESYYKRLGSNYAKAILQSGVKRIVNLSSIGAHLHKGSGLILHSAHKVENILKSLPDDVAISFMRPAGFYYNLLNNVQTIKSTSKGFLGIFMALRFYGLSGLLGGKRGVIVSNYGGKDIVPWVSPKDIASVIAGEMEKPFTGRTFRYIASEELSCDEVAKTLGEAIGKPYLKWGIISDKQLLSIVTGLGMNPIIAKGLVEMTASQHTGKLFENYYLNRPVLGKSKLTEFANEFAVAFKQQ